MNYSLLKNLPLGKEVYKVFYGAESSGMELKF
jgi:hypothetical protein